MKGVLSHCVGDYLLQSHWMAINKTSSNTAAAAHALAYTTAFAPLKPNAKQIAAIAGTHYLIDRYRLARYVVWAKDWIAPKGQKHEMTATGMQRDVPPWLATWLMIITDNLMHIMINGMVLRKG